MVFISPHPRTESHNRFGFARSRRQLGALLVAMLALGGVGVVQADGAQAAEPVANVSTTTTMSLLVEPKVYGDALAVTTTVTPQGAAFVMGSIVQLVVDGVVNGEGVLIYIGEGKFRALIPAAEPLSVGTHSVVVRFPGTSDGDPRTPDALPSESDPLTVIIAQAPTTTTITSAPTSPTAFTPIDVTARVESSRSGFGGSSRSDFGGSAALLADGAPLATKDLEEDGTVQFNDVVVPYGTAALSVAYLGDDSGNFAISESAAIPILVEKAATETHLSLSSHHVSASGAVNFVVTVRNINEANLVDPRSGFQLLIDDEVFYTEVSSADGDPVQADGTTQFEAELSHLPIGSHTVSARFLPASGFGESESEPVDLRVDAIATALIPEKDELQGTPQHPAMVAVTIETTPAEGNDMTRLSAAGELVDGHVQAFLGGEAIGEPFEVIDGRGSGPLSDLPLGTHEVELRFASESYGVLSSSVFVSVTVTADPTPTGTAGPAVLSSTGATGPSPLVMTVLAMLLGGGALMILASQRRSHLSRRR